MYIEWPPEAAGNSIRVGILGSGQAVKEIQNMLDQKTVGHRKITVTGLSAANAAEMKDCQVIFVTAEYSHRFAATQRAVANAPVLVITEKQGLAQEGSGINFVEADGKIKFEINEKTLRKSGLKVLDKLLALGIRIKS